MLALFAVGVVTGTILSFELGLLWPGFMATFGDVFGLGFALEGFSFFLEAIFIAIYVYGWDRLSPRAHLLAGIPIVIAGVTGSLMVISVNALDEPPDRASGCADGKAVDVAPLVGALRQPVLLARARAHVLRRLHRRRLPAWPRAYAWGWLRGRRSRYERTALVDPADGRRARRAGAGRRRRLGRARRRRGPAGQARRVRGAGRDDRRARRSTSLGWYDGRRGQVRDRDPAAALAARRPRPERDACRASTPCPRGGPAAGQRRALSPSRRWSGSARCSRCSASSTSVAWLRRRRLPRVALVLPRGRRRRAARRSSR